MKPARRRPFRLTVLLTAVFLCLPPAGATAVDDLAARSWIEVDSPNFRVVTEQPEDVARLMVTDLENLRYISSRLRGAKALDGPPLTIVAMGKRSFGSLGLPDTMRGVFTLGRHGYAAIASIEDYVKSPDRSDFSRSTILHEYHHFLLHYAPETTSYPMWYDEGMAEYWSSLLIEDGKAWFGHPVEGGNREYWLVNQMGRVSFDTQTLFSTTALKFDGARNSNEDIGRFYGRSRYAIHYFQSSPALRQQLANYLRLHNMGLSQDQAVRLAFKKTYAELNEDMRLYAERRLTVRGFSIGKDGLDLPQVTVKITRLDRAAAIAVLADVIPRFGRSASAVAKELVAANLALHPDDPGANVLALAAHVVDDGATRLPALLARHPNDARLLTARADAVSRDAYARISAGAPGWGTPLREARTLYRRAIAADPSDPLPYHGLGFLNLALPADEPPQEGIACLDTAVLFEPTPDTFRALAKLYLRDKQLPLALKSMRSAVAFGASAGADRPLDALLMENLELVADMRSSATPDDKGLRYKSGSAYVGTMLDNKPHGKGTWSRPNGSTYEGDFLNGIPSGHGRLVSERGVSYEGEFAAGMAHGRGRIGFPAGSNMVSYEGGVDAATFDGKGVLVTKDGRMEGSFVDGKAQGEGMFTPARNTVPMKGVWRFGDFAWAEAAGMQFTGGIDADGRRNGNGWCRAAGSGPVAPCRYKDGQKIAAE
jgi:hypothetical protein